MLSDNLVSSIAIQEILSRSMEGKSVSRTEAYQLLRSREDNLIASTARYIRNTNLNSGTITYSRKVFVD